jgi:uncharacterized protein DUF3352
MGSMRVSVAALLAGAVLVVAGCGGGENVAATGEGAASIAPKSASLYASLDTDLESGQVEQLRELLAKFPDRARLLDQLQKGLAEEDLSWETDVRPALGDTLDVVVLGLDDGDTVALLRPADEKKLQELLDKAEGDPVTQTIEGWTAIAENDAALERFEAARAEGSLADDDRFREALDGLPDEALAKLYVNGDAATEAAERAGGKASGTNRLQAFAAALGAESSGIRLDGALQAELADDLTAAKPYEPTLLDAAPEDALAFVSGHGQGQIERALRDAPGVLDRLRSMLGVDTEALSSLFEGEFALWVGAGAPIPEVTLLAEVEDEQRALAAVDKLAAMVPDSQRQTAEVDGVQAKQIVVEGLPVTYAAFDGRLILTTRAGAIADVRGGGDSLADDADFKQARDDAGLGDTTFGLVYLDLDRLVSLVGGFAAVSGEAVPPEVLRNLEPLGTFLVHAGGEPEDLNLSAFLAID